MRPTRSAAASGCSPGSEGSGAPRRSWSTAARAIRRSRSPAGTFRASRWRERPFREDLPGCEDREWSWYWLERGYRCVVDPGFVVDHDHTHDSLPAIYRRARREAEGLAMFSDGAADARGLIGEWWSDRRYY